MYTYNGKEYSLEQIQKMATDNGYGEDYQTYLDDHPDFQPGPAEESAVVGPENVAQSNAVQENTELSLEDTFSDSQDDVPAKEPGFLQKIINVINESAFSKYGGVAGFNESNEPTAAQLRAEEEKKIETARVDNDDFKKEKKVFSSKIEQLLNDPSILKKITQTKENPEGVSNFEFILPEAFNGLGKNMDAYEDILKVIKPILLEDYNGPVLEKDVDKLFKNILTDRALLSKRNRDVGEAIKGIEYATEDFSNSGEGGSPVENAVYSRGVAIDVYQQKDIKNYTEEERSIYDLKTIVDNLRKTKGEAKSIIEAQSAYVEALKKFGGNDPWTSQEQLTPHFDGDGNIIGTAATDDREPNPLDITTGDLNNASASLSATPKSSWEGARDSNLFERYTSDKTGQNTFNIEVGTSEMSQNLLESYGYTPIKSENGKKTYKNVKVIDIAKGQNILFGESSLTEIESSLDQFGRDVKGFINISPGDEKAEIDKEFSMDEDKPDLSSRGFYEFIKGYTSDRKSIIANQRTLSRVVTLGINPSSLNNTSGSILKDGIKRTFELLSPELVPDIEDGDGRSLDGSEQSNRATLDALDLIINEEGLPTTTETKDKIKRTRAYEFFEGAVGMAPVVAKFAAIDVALKKVGAITGFPALMSKLLQPRYYKAGKLMTPKQVTALGTPGTSKFKNALTKKKITTKGAATINKAIYHATYAAREEGKVSVAFGDQYHVGGGAAFYGVGAMIPKWVTPFNGLNTMLNTTLNGGIAFSISSEVAQNFESIARDISGNETYSRFVEDRYSDLWDDEVDFLDKKVIKEGIGNLFLGAALGGQKLLTSSTGMSLMSSNALYKINNKSYKVHKKLTTELENTKTEKDVNGLVDSKKIKELEQKIEDNIEVISLSESQINILENNQAFSNPVTAGKLYSKRYNKVLEGLGERGKPAKIIAQQGNEGFVNKEAAAEARKVDGVMEIMVDLNKVTPGKLPHEVFHLAAQKLFKGNPNALKQFKSMISESFKDIKFEWTNKAGEGKTGNLEEFITDKYPDAKTAEEFMAYSAEILADPKMYRELTGKGTWGILRENMVSWGERNIGFSTEIVGKEQLINLMGRYANSVKSGYSTSKQMKRLLNVKLPEVIEADNRKLNEIIIDTRKEAGSDASRDLISEKEALMARQKELVPFVRTNQDAKDEAKENATLIQELNKNIKKSTENEQDITTFQEQTRVSTAEAVKSKRYLRNAGGDLVLNKKGKPILAPLKTTKAIIAENRLIENNQGIIQKELAKFDSKLGGNYADFKGDVYKAVGDLMKTWKPGVSPFGAYLKTNLPLRTPGIFDKIGERTKGKEDLFDVSLDKAMNIPESTVDFSDLIDLSPSKRIETAIHGINPVNTIVDSKLRNQIIEANNSSFESINVADLLAGPAAPGGKLKNQDIKGIAELFGVDFKKIQSKTANLSQKEVLDAQERIIDMAPVLIELASRPNNVRQSGNSLVSDIYINSTMGLNSSLKKAWYKKGERIGNNTEFILKPEILDSNGKIREDIFMKQFGLKIDKDGKYIKFEPSKRNGFDPSIKGVIDFFGKDVTNVLFRKHLNKPGVFEKVFEQSPELAKDISLPQMLIDFAAGKPEAMQSFELVREGFKLVDPNIKDFQIYGLLDKFIKGEKIDNKWINSIDTARWASQKPAERDGQPFIEKTKVYDSYYSKNVTSWTSKLKWTPEELAKSKKDYNDTYITKLAEFT